MAKKKKKSGKQLSAQASEQSSSSQSKSSDDKWLWLLITVILIFGFLGYRWTSSIKIPETASSGNIENSVDRFKSYEKNLSFHSQEVRESILNIFTNKEIAEDIGSSSSLPELVYNFRFFSNCCARAKRRPSSTALSQLASSSVTPCMPMNSTGSISASTRRSRASSGCHSA